jgi:hypothetical protein
MAQWRVNILQDIKLSPRHETFFRRSAHIRYDAKSPKATKIHQLIHQQGDRYGEVGDCCEYLTHAELLDLEAGGYVQIVRGSR